MKLQPEIIQILNDEKIGTFATIQSGKPMSRFMLFFHEDSFLYTATHKETHKVEEIEKNPYVHLLLGLESAKNGGAYCEIEATVAIDNSNDKKQKFWCDQLKEWISSPEDPNYVLLKITPQKVCFYDNMYSKPKELTYS